MNEACVVGRTQAWLNTAVVGLNLCPFAKSVVVKNQVRFVVSPATQASELLEQLGQELCLLAAADPEKIDTTLLIHPKALADFTEFNAFLGPAERLLRNLRLTGVLQLASFHPQYCFADAEPDDPANATNQAPYPTLHLIREDSIARAAQAFPEPEAIFERNMSLLRQMGPAGVAQLKTAWADPDAP